MRLVATKSLSKDEKAIAKLIASEMRTLGYDMVTTDGFYNVAGKIGNGRTKILYDAHTDTVGVSDEKNWKTNPFKAVFKKGHIYGRGSCDDKGCVAAMVYAGALIKKLGLTGDFTLMVSASAREEIGGTEWLEFVIRELKFKPDFVVIGEPSDLKIIYGHKGRAEFKITVSGRSVHASIPEEGENAIYNTLPIIEKIRALNKKYKYAKLGKPVISVTKIETKNASINSIPDKCIFYIDRRTVETENRNFVTSEIKKIIGPKGKIEYIKYYSPWLMKRNHNLLKSAEKTFKNTYGEKPAVVTWPFCTNGSFTMGDRKIPTIGFGPGEEKKAHVDNESIKFADVIKSLEFYAKLPAELSKAQ